MADDEDPDSGLRLNTIDRFRKQSPRLLLEEYSHCEVPAGCGGVVLRWVDPAAGVPASVRIVVVGDGTAQTWIDGVEVDSAQVLVESGERVLAIELRELGAGPAMVFVELLRALGQERHGSDRPVLTWTRGDSSWRASPSASVDERWTAKDFVDLAWPALADGTDRLDAQTRRSYRIRSMLEAGTRGCVIEPELIHAGVARIRHRFSVAPIDPEARRREAR